MPPACLISHLRGGQLALPSALMGQHGHPFTPAKGPSPLPPVSVLLLDDFLPSELALPLESWPYWERDVGGTYPVAWATPSHPLLHLLFSQTLK